MLLRVINDFCPEIESVRDSFLASGFGNFTPNSSKAGSGKYTGVNFVGLHHLLLYRVIQGLGCTFIPNSMFARITNEDTEKAYIHSDREHGNITAIVYLSKHDQPSGTAFYRHRETGLLEMPSEWMNDEDRGKEMVEASDDVWEQTDYIGGIYNRAIIFNAPLFHGRFPNTGIGTDEETGRMVWVCHGHIPA